MKTGCRSVCRKGALFTCAITGLLFIDGVWAVNLTPGQTATVFAGGAPEVWGLQGATLNVEPGGQTLGINAGSGSTLNFTGGSTNGPVSVVGSTGTFTDSTLDATIGTGSRTGIGLAVTSQAANPNVLSSAVVTNSVIKGIGRGVNVSTGNSLTLTGTQVTGSGTGPTFLDNGSGLTAVGGNAVVQGGSVVTGSNRGAILVDNNAAFINPSLIVDDATITGTAGSGIFISSLQAANTPTVILRNGAVVSGGNGVLVQVGESTTPSRFVSTLDLQIDASTLAGDIQVFSNNVANVTMANGSRLTGNLTDISSLSLNNSELTGDIVQNTGAAPTISLANKARVTGTIINARSTTLDGTSTFNMVNDSSVGDLTLNGGTVNLRAGGVGFHTLTASSLAGAGTFAIGTDVAGHLSDLVNITGNASGDHLLAVQNTGVDAVQETHAQQLVHTGSGNASFAVIGGQVDVGTFVYRLEQRNADWFLVQQTTGGGEGPGGEGPGGEVPGGGGPGGEEGAGGEGGGGGTPIISPSARAVVGVFSAAPTVWYGELSTLRSRMGELRNGHEQGSFWVRTYGNKYKVSATDQVDYAQTQSGVSFGVDTPISNQDGQWLVGVMGGYSNSNLNLRLGTSGQVNSYYLGLYSTWVSTSGYYVDAVLKANRFSNKTDVRMSDGVKAKGDYNNYGFGGSLEVGKHIPFGDVWFVEPYAQASALWVEGENYGLDNGLEASSNHADSFVGKVGTHLGRTIALDRGGFVQPYVKVAAAQEFARSNKVKVNRTTFSDDLSGTRGEWGAGIAAQVSNVLQVHADLDYSSGERIEQPWGVNLGLRYSW